LVDEYLAKTKQGRCNTFREAAEAVARQALPMFLNISANVTSWNAEGNECSLVRRLAVPWMYLELSIPQTAGLLECF
jgi:hypothetical protein